MKRFWRATSVSSGPAGYGVALDDRPVTLPGGGILVVPFEPLAAAIAGEWADVGDNFTVDDLPLTRLAATAQGRVVLQRDAIIAQLLAYGLNDLLCYREPADAGLAAREADAWQPWLDWAADRLGAVLSSTAGVMPISQSADAAAALQAALAAFSDYGLAGLGVIVPALGSLVLGLGVARGALAPEAACALAHINETMQEQRYGVDPETAARRAIIMEDVAVSARFMVLCKP